MMAPAQLLNRTLVVVAHPDDESVGCGALLGRMRRPVVVFCTDGAPHNPYFWQAHETRERYRDLRRQEARAALATSGVTELHFLDFSDQELFRNAPAALAELSRIARQAEPDALLTLAYEGGHPDHDTCSFLGSRLALCLGLPAWEMPLYHRAQGAEITFQRFLESRDGEVDFEPTEEELERKRKMIAAYASQQLMLTPIPPSPERFRPQPAYDYTRPPHAGATNYQAWGWPISPEQLCAAFAAAMSRSAEVS